MREKPMPKSPADPWKKAVKHLKSIDASWSDLIDRAGPCAIRPRDDHFSILVRSIIGQQISSKAAASIDAKLRELAGPTHEPAALLKLGEEPLRSVGLSGVKARYVLNLSEAVANGAVPLERIDTLSDDEVIKHLTSVKGVGVWTAEMFLMFALARPDVLPVGDLAIRTAIRNHHDLPEMPKPKECFPLAEPWRPYRTVASWYLWASLRLPKVEATVQEPTAIIEAKAEKTAPTSRKRK